MDMGDASGVRRVYSTSEASLLSVPEWNPEKDAPPLPIAKAVASAREWLRKKHPKFDDVRLRDIHLQEVQCSSVPRHRWFYTLGFDPVIDGQAFWGGHLSVVILTNGTIIEPVEKRGD
jgi:hypothetical protein